MPNGTYGGVRGRRKSSLLDYINFYHQSASLKESSVISSLFFIFLVLDRCSFYGKTHLLDHLDVF